LEPPRQRGEKKPERRVTDNEKLKRELRLISAVCRERFSRPKRSGAGLALPCCGSERVTVVVESPAMLVAILATKRRAHALGSTKR